MSEIRWKTWFLVVGAVLAIGSPTGINAEVHRFALEEVMEQILEIHRAEGELGSLSVPLNEVVEKLPERVRVVATENKHADAMGNAMAVFAEKPIGGEIRDSIRVGLDDVGDGTYRVATDSVAKLREWFTSRVVALMRREVVVESVEGLAGGAVLVRLADGEATTALVSLQDDTGEPSSGDVLRGLLEQLTGRSIAHVAFVDVEGEDRRFTDLGGGAVLLHVWATWCVPCIAAMPSLEALQDRYRDRGFTVVHLSDEPAEVIREWLSANPTEMVHGRVDDFGFLLGASQGAAEHKVGVRPVYVILDREGIARDHRVGASGVQLKIVSGEEGTVQSGTVREGYLSEWVKPYL